MIDLPPMNHDQAIHAVAACGVPAANISISHIDELQLDVVSIGRLDERLTPAALSCVFHAVIPAGYDVRFEDDAQNVAFWQLVFEEGRARAHARGQAWLGERGLLENMPRFEPDGDLADYARRVETHCGLEPGSTLEALDAGTLTFRSRFTEAMIGDQAAADTYLCLSNVLAASNLAHGGVTVGFVGNELISEGDDR